MHGDRRVVKLNDWQSDKVIPIVTSYNNKLFNSPNDLVYNSKNELFFTDPPYGLKKCLPEVIRIIKEKNLKFKTLA